MFRCWRGNQNSGDSNSHIRQRMNNHARMKLLDASNTNSPSIVMYWWERPPGRDDIYRGREATPTKHYSRIELEME